MKVCPIAIVAGCAKCPIVKVCPLKGVLGDYSPPAAPPVAPARSESRKASAPTEPGPGEAKPRAGQGSLSRRKKRRARPRA